MAMSSSSFSTVAFVSLRELATFLILTSRTSTFSWIWTPVAFRTPSWPWLVEAPSNNSPFLIQMIFV
jgi:hypothetical protein